MELLDARNDFIFKKIFGSENNKDVLLAFLNSTFMESGEPPLTEIILMNPYTDKDAPAEKLVHTGHQGENGRGQANQHRNAIVQSLQYGEADTFLLE